MKMKLLLIMLFVGLGTSLNAEAFMGFDSTFDFDVSKTACDEGNARECIILSLMYIKGTDELEKDYKKAKFFAEKACEYKHRMGCMILLNIDEEEAKEILAKRCSDGDDKACLDLKKLNNQIYYLIDGKCSKCDSSNIGKYLYGLVHPDEKMEVKIDKGEIILGGCMISEDSPKYHCLKCGATLYVQTPIDNK